MKIQDLKVGDNCVIPLIVLDVTARETKAKKPYLAFELFDGIDRINANYWDWDGNRQPVKNTILNVAAKVVEWQNVPQLQIKKLTTNTELTPADFMPQSGLDIESFYKSAYALCLTVRDDMYRDLLLHLLEEKQGDWLAAPAAKFIHHAYVGGLLIHSLSVAHIAKSIAEEIPTANIDLCITGAMLHDIGKMQSYYIDGAAIELTSEGKLCEHTFIGANLISQICGKLFDITLAGMQQKLSLLQHVILSHHGALEHGAVVTPNCIEAIIVHHADSIDAAAEVISHQKPANESTQWTEKIWVYNNNQFLLPSYIRDVFSQQ